MSQKYPQPIDRRAIVPAYVPDEVLTIDLLTHEQRAERDGLTVAPDVTRAPGRTMTLTPYPTAQTPPQIHPAINHIEPEGVYVGGYAVELVVHGVGFSPWSTVYLGGKPQPRLRFYSPVRISTIFDPMNPPTPEVVLPVTVMDHMMMSDDVPFTIGLDPDIESGELLAGSFTLPDFAGKVTYPNWTKLLIGDVTGTVMEKAGDGVAMLASGTARIQYVATIFNKKGSTVGFGYSVNYGAVQKLGQFTIPGQEPVMVYFSKDFMMSEGDIYHCFISASDDKQNTTATAMRVDVITGPTIFEEQP